MYFTEFYLPISYSCCKCYHSASETHIGTRLVRMIPDCLKNAKKDLHQTPAASLFSPAINFQINGSLLTVSKSL